VTGSRTFAAFVEVRTVVGSVVPGGLPSYPLPLPPTLVEAVVSASTVVVDVISDSTVVGVTSAVVVGTVNGAVVHFPHKTGQVDARVGPYNGWVQSEGIRN
jgi:hypothetical protein